MSLFFAISCEHKSIHHNSESKVTIGKSLKASKYSNLYFAGQPAEQDYKKIKDQGFVAIINLRQKSEYDEFLEKKRVEKLGMVYHNIPMDMSKPLDNDYVSKVTTAVVSHRKNGNVLVHCSTGNRVGIWLGAHFYKDHGYSKAEAIQQARLLGLTKSKPLVKLQEYLESH